MKRDSYDRQVEMVDMDEASALAVKIVMQEGALRMQDIILDKIDDGTDFGDWAAQIVEEIDIEEIFKNDDVSE